MFDRAFIFSLPLMEGTYQKCRPALPYGTEARAGDSVAGVNLALFGQDHSGHQVEDHAGAPEAAQGCPHQADHAGVQVEVFGHTAADPGQHGGAVLGPVELFGFVHEGSLLLFFTVLVV